MTGDVHILVVGLPAMLREIVEDAVVDAPGMRLVGDGAPVPDLGAAVRAHEAGFVVGGASALDPDAVADALHAFPALRVLSLSQSGRTATLHELRPHHEPLGEASSERLVAVIREHASTPVAT